MFMLAVYWWCDMAYFLFQPNKEVEVDDAWKNQGRQFKPMSFLYNSKTDMWMVFDPKSNNFIKFMHAGVPEIYRAQVLLLSAAYPD